MYFKKLPLSVFCFLAGGGLEPDVCWLVLFALSWCFRAAVICSLLALILFIISLFRVCTMYVISLYNLTYVFHFTCGNRIRKLLAEKRKQVQHQPQKIHGQFRRVVTGDENKRVRYAD